MKSSDFILETDMIRRMGFGAKGYNVGASLKSAFNEFHPDATDSYARKIQQSSADPEIKDRAFNSLNSIKSKGDDLKTLLNDFNFDDESELASTLFNKLSGDADEGEEGTLKFYDFNIDSSIESGMIENAAGLLDQLDQFFDILMGILGDPSLSTQKPDVRKMGFRESTKNKYRKEIKEYLKELFGKNEQRSNTHYRGSCCEWCNDIATGHAVGSIPPQGQINGVSCADWMCGNQEWCPGSKPIQNPFTSKVDI